MNYWLWILPVLTAVCGWLIVWIIIRMLLRSGKLQQRLMQDLSIIVTAELEKTIDIEKKISEPGLLKNATPVIEKHVDDFLRVRLSRDMPFISHFIGDKTITSLKKIFMEELETLFPEVMKGFARQIKADLSPENYIKKKMAAFSPEQFRQALSKFLSSDLRKLYLFALLVGFLFGVIEMIILHLTL